jgi:hypothetical protein
MGEDFVRDPSNVKVDSSNVNELLKDANGDTEASRAILDKLAGTSDPKMQAAAVKAANQASGLTELILTNLDVVTGADSNNGSLETLAQTVLGEARRNDITGIAIDIVNTLPVDVSGAKPEFAGSFVKSVSTSDLTILLVTMMMAEVTDGDFENYVNGWGTTSGGKNISSAGSLDSKNERVIAAIANEVIGRPDSKLGNMLKNLVGEN